jgi:GNAT superfamily N-acetyltransferase
MIRNMANDFVLRRAIAGDAEGIARVHTRSWQSAYKGILPDDFLDALRWESRIEAWSGIISTTQTTTNDIFVATDADSAVAGFASIGEVRDDDLISQMFFELQAIYVAPELWNQGVGRALMEVALTAMPPTTPGLSLWVLAANERGRRFY